MLDSITGQRLVVRPTEFAPSVLLRSWEDLDFVDDVLTERHGIETSHRELLSAGADSGYELFLHTSLELPAIQKLLDDMSTHQK